MGVMFVPAPVFVPEVDQELMEQLTVRLRQERRLRRRQASQVAARIGVALQALAGDEFEVGVRKLRALVAVLEREGGDQDAEELEEGPVAA